jgi:proteasome lid subunit RPN8/RPN11
LKLGSVHVEFLLPDVESSLRAACLVGGAQEKVGVVLGRGHLICEIITLPNRTGLRDAFQVLDDDVAAAKRHAEINGHQVIGRYHTHPPNRPAPSLQDRISLPPEWFELIVCVGRRDGQLTVTSLRAYDHQGRPLGLAGWSARSAVETVRLVE